MTQINNTNPIRPATAVRTNEQVRNDPRAVDPKELEGKTQQEQDQLVAARAETLAAKQPDGTFNFTNNTTSSAQALDPAGRALQRGTSGPEAAALQQQLNLNGANPPLKVDGRFGQKTEQALREYQRANGLPDDGKAGKDTINAMKANDAISRMNQYGGRTDAESQAKYAQAKTEAEKAMGELNASGKQSPEAKAAMESKMAEAAKKNDATAGPAPIDTSKPATDQVNQAAANATAAGNAAAKQTALQQGREALDKAKAEVAAMPAGDAKTAAENRLKEAEQNLTNAAGTAARESSSQAEAASKEARAAADDAAAKQKAADQAAMGPHTPETAARAAQLQQAANEAKTNAEAKAKAAEQAIKDAQAIADNPITPQADKDYANRNLTNARQDLSAGQTQNNLTAPASGEQTPEAKAALERAKADARALNDQNNQNWFNDNANQNQVGAKLAEGLLAQSGKLPDGTARSLIEGLGKVGSAEEVAAGLVNRLGAEGVAKLSDADKKYLLDTIGTFRGWTSDAPQVQAARLLGDTTVTLDRPLG